MLMDRRITLRLHRQGLNEFGEGTGPEIAGEKTLWAHRRSDTLQERETTNRGILEFVQVARRDYVIRPRPVVEVTDPLDPASTVRVGLREFADKYSHDAIHLIGEDGESWFLRGLVEEGRNRWWVIECERLHAP